MELLSCDTMVALGNSTKSGNVIFAKNSDRPLGESQPLQKFEAADYAEGELLSCTYITIPQVNHTYKVLGSKPFWMWGFEHGINEHGVVIGNEAVWSREKEEGTNGLIGMDLLRLGLERGKTAYEALHIITDLLETYGQGGNAAFQGEFRYHNSFLIADRREAWILDTVNRRWVARKVTDVAGISNCYSTEEHWDEGSKDIIEHAYKKGYASPEEKFNFAKAYGLIDIRTRSAYPRYHRLNQLLERYKGQITVATLQSIQRDHYEGEIIEPRWSPADGIMASICMHNLDVNSSKTAAGAVVELADDKEPVWWSCMSNPCMSVFLPFALDRNVPKTVSYAGKTYEDGSLWWKVERLTYEIELDYPRNIVIWKQEKTKFEEKLQTDFCNVFSDEMIDAVVNEYIALLDKVYDKLKCINVTTGEPQRMEQIKLAKQNAKID